MVRQYQRKTRRWKKGLVLLAILLILALSVFSAYVVHLKSNVEFTREDIIIIYDTPPDQAP